ncbi:2-oxo-3-hexenedioate decarboxylase [Nocardia sp. GAS34]|uniref:2-keto-4-pentenoate hydratase n=1 Tax=unclassified Nocardia TaxID=2637762 RepID=UPI003D1B8B64
MTPEQAVVELLDREDGKRAGPPLTATWPDLDVATAYEIQKLSLDRRLRAGQRITGIKLGLTSEAKQRSMGVDTPLTGWLTDTMLLSAGAPLPLDRFIHPRAEPEIVLIMGSRLAGPGVTAKSALAAVAEVRAGIEIIDSRYTDFRFTLADVIADNASSAGYYLGATAVAPAEIDIVVETGRLDIDNRTVGTASGAAILGNPAEALALAANALAEHGSSIEAGWAVLTGGLVDAAQLDAGMRLIAAFTRLGVIDVTVGS